MFYQYLLACDQRYKIEKLHVPSRTQSRVHCKTGMILNDLPSINDDIEVLKSRNYENMISW